MAGYRRVDYVKLAAEALRCRDDRDDSTGDPPWPDYNGGKQFCCKQCGTRFDTSAGHARHLVYGCSMPPAPPAIRTMPACPVCGSFALYREKDGRLTCMTCPAWEGELR